MPIALLLRRILLYRLLRYRFAWFAFSFLMFYLSLIFLLVFGTAHQVTVAGTLGACQRERDSSGATTDYLFTLAQTPQVRLRLVPDNFSPNLNADLCLSNVAQVSYETNPIGGPFLVDRVSLRESGSGALASFTTTNGRDYPTAKRLSTIVWSGGTGLLGVAMLVVAIMWKRVGSLVQRRKQRLAHGTTGGTTGSATGGAKRGVVRGAGRAAKRGAGHGAAVPVRAALPAAFIQRAGDDLRWLASLPWGITAGPDAEEAWRRFDQGVAYARGSQGREEPILDAVDLFVRCPPSLSYTGAAELALHFARLDLLTWLPEGAQAAIVYAEHALTFDSASTDAQITLVHALAALGAASEPAALDRAEATLHRLREADPAHPRLPSAVAAVYLARRQYAPAIQALRLAHQVAPSREEAVAILDQLAHTVERTGDLRLALRLFMQLSAAGGIIAATDALAGQPDVSDANDAVAGQPDATPDDGSQSDGVLDGVLEDEVDWASLAVHVFSGSATATAEEEVVANEQYYFDE